MNIRRATGPVILAALISLACLPLARVWSAGSEASAGRKASGVRVVLGIEPGTDIDPEISDPNRVKTILKLIEDVYFGRPLQYPKDGAVFQNKEGKLPPQPKGFYREYTVMPPKGSPSDITVGGRPFHIAPANGTRGVERLIIGGGALAYYTPDHYKTFIPLVIIR